MRTDFFNRKTWRYIVLSQALAIVLLCVLVCITLQISSKTVAVGRSFCFLVSQDSHIQAGAYEVQIHGGAGYLLSYQEEEYVALAVYLKEEDAQRVISQLPEQEEVTLCILTSPQLPGLDKEEGKESIRRQALDCLYGCMQVLEQETARLDRGATQESSLQIIETLIRQFRFLANKYIQTYSDFSKVCLQAKSFLEGCANPILYVRDLRYLLCELAFSYVDLALNL